MGKWVGKWGKWGNGKMGKWGNGKMGKWEDRKMGRWECVLEKIRKWENQKFPLHFSF